MFLFVGLSEGIDATAVLPRALARRVAFVPGEEFYCNGGGRHTMRLNFSNPPLGTIVEGVQRLAEIVKAMDVAAGRPYRIQTDFITG